MIYCRRHARYSILSSRCSVADAAIADEKVQEALLLLAIALASTVAAFFLIFFVTYRVKRSIYRRLSRGEETTRPPAVLFALMLIFPMVLIVGAVVVSLALWPRLYTATNNVPSIIASFSHSKFGVFLQGRAYLATLESFQSSDINLYESNLTRSSTHHVRGSSLKSCAQSCFFQGMSPRGIRYFWSSLRKSSRWIRVCLKFRRQ